MSSYVTYNDIIGTVGNTPMVKLNKVTVGVGGLVYGKCEFMNPGGSVKDRIGLAMVEAAEKEGSLKEGGVIVEATSGNTGIALALVAATRGYRCIFTMPDKMSREKVKLLESFGAEVVITPSDVPPDHPDHYTVRAQTIADQTSGAILANQFYNQANPRAHYETTGPEIWEQTEGRITHFLAGAGTGGTISGVGRYLKEKNPSVKIFGVDPKGSILKNFYDTGEMAEGHSYKVEGLGSDKVPGSLDMEVIDGWITVDDFQAFQMARRLTREEGLFVGGSSGLLVHAAVELARGLDSDAVIVTILCDWGEHYMSKLYDDEWMLLNGFAIEKEAPEL